MKERDDFTTRVATAKFVWLKKKIMQLGIYKLFRVASYGYLMRDHTVQRPASSISVTPTFVPTCISGTFKEKKRKCLANDDLPLDEAQPRPRLQRVATRTSPSKEESTDWPFYTDIHQSLTLSFLHALFYPLIPHPHPTLLSQQATLTWTWGGGRQLLSICSWPTFYLSWFIFFTTPDNKSGLGLVVQPTFHYTDFFLSFRTVRYFAYFSKTSAQCLQQNFLTVFENQTFDEKICICLAIVNARKEFQAGILSAKELNSWWQKFPGCGHSFSSSLTTQIVFLVPLRHKRVLFEQKQ